MYYFVFRFSQDSWWILFHAQIKIRRTQYCWLFDPSRLRTWLEQCLYWLFVSVCIYMLSTEHAQPVKVMLWLWRWSLSGVRLLAHRKGQIKHTLLDTTTSTLEIRLYAHWRWARRELYNCVTFIHTGRRANLGNVLCTCLCDLLVMVEVFFCSLICWLHSRW